MRLGVNRPEQRKKSRLENGSSTFPFPSLLIYDLLPSLMSLKLLCLLLLLTGFAFGAQPKVCPELPHIQTINAHYWNLFK